MALIAVVDDEQVWRDLFGEALGAAGYTVATFPGGAGAAREVAARRPDLVVLDIRMYPSGREVLRAIRQLLPGTPAVVVSTYGGYRDDPDFATAAAFLEKSSDTSRLLHTVERLLRSAPAASG
jgi:DNA-binding NtrC family response regulator